MPDKAGADYLWGNSKSEIDRVVAQSEVLRPATCRLLEATGTKPGMRVLDVGCGAGDVALLARDMVGPQGSVVGIDQDLNILAVARDRARAEGKPDITFLEASLASFGDPEGFDLVVCRFVLHHQHDPLSFLKALASAVRPGGVLAVLEPGVRPKQLSTPPVQLYEDAFEACFGAVRLVCPHHDVAYRLAALFDEAGLAQPHLFSETPTGSGEECPFYALVADTFGSARSVIKKHGLWRGDTMPDASMEEKIRTEAIRLKSQLQYPEQICAWVRA